MDLKEHESSALGQQTEPTGEGTADEVTEGDLKVARIAYRRGRGENVDDEGPLSEEEKVRVARFRPARDYEHVRRWQDQHLSPEQIAGFEAARRRWHELNDGRSS